MIGIALAIDAAPPITSPTPPPELLDDDAALLPLGGVPDQPLVVAIFA